MSGRSDIPDIEDGTRAAILNAAGRRFSRFGPKKTSMSEIARDAGVARATLYLHFDGKDDLYSALLARESARFLAAAEEIMAGSGHAPRKLRALVEATTAIYAKNPVLQNALAGDPDMTIENVARRAIRRNARRIQALLRKVIDQGVAEGTLREVDSEAVSYLMYSLGNLLLMRELSGRQEFSFTRILGAMDDLIARGLLAKNDRSAPK